MDKIKENKFVVKAKKIWSKHKIIVSVLGGFLVLICLFGIREASLVDPLDGVQQSGMEFVYGFLGCSR